jgi:hypothetical protein
MEPDLGMPAINMMGLWFKAVFLAAMLGYMVMNYGMVS